MYDDGSSEGGPKGTFEIYRAEGDVLFKRFEFKKALNSYTTVSIGLAVFLKMRKINTDTVFATLPGVYSLLLTPH